MGTAFLQDAEGIFDQVLFQLVLIVNVSVCDVYATGYEMWV